MLTSKQHERTILRGTLGRAMAPGWVTASETRGEYLPVRSPKTSLFLKVSEAVTHPDALKVLCDQQTE